MGLEEFKERVVQLLMDYYAPHKEESFLRECVEDEYFQPAIEDGYKHEFGIEYGIRYAARNISLCI